VAYVVVAQDTSPTVTGVEEDLRKSLEDGSAFDGSNANWCKHTLFHECFGSVRWSQKLIAASSSFSDYSRRRPSAWRPCNK
jgi:hypothetical protein